MIIKAPAILIALSLLFILGGYAQAADTSDAPVCDESLWEHVYAGKFSRPQDRLKVITPCLQVSGVIDAKFPPVKEADGDWHIRLKVDPEFKKMLNSKNVSGQHGDLVLEPVCSNSVKQKDTIKEGVCMGFQQHIFIRSMIGKHVIVTGVYVTDMEHGWNEIHPVTSIISESK